MLMNASSNCLICDRSAWQAAFVLFLSAAVEVNARYWSLVLILEDVKDVCRCAPIPVLDVPTDADDDDDVDDVDLGDEGTLPIATAR